MHTYIHACMETHTQVHHASMHIYITITYMHTYIQTGAFPNAQNKKCVRMIGSQQDDPGHWTNFECCHDWNYICEPGVDNLAITETCEATTTTEAATTTTVAATTTTVAATTTTAAASTTTAAATTTSPAATTTTTAVMLHTKPTCTHACLYT